MNRHGRRAAAARGLPTSGPSLAPFVEFQNSGEAQELRLVQRHGYSVEEVRRIWDSEKDLKKYFHNGLYQVVVSSIDDPFTLISVSRLDEQAARSWWDMQQIKNIFLGPECEAVELYPAESRLINLGNTYHLWGERDPTFRWGFGWVNGRQVRGERGRT